MAPIEAMRMDHRRFDLIIAEKHLNRADAIPAEQKALRCGGCNGEREELRAIDRGV